MDSVVGKYVVLFLRNGDIVEGACVVDGKREFRLLHHEDGRLVIVMKDFVAKAEVRDLDD